MPAEGEGIDLESLTNEAVLLLLCTIKTISRYWSE